MSRQLSRSQAVRLGLVVAVALGIVGWAVFALGQRFGLGRDSFVVHVGFQDIGGVEVGTRVRLQGIDAGEVEAIDLPDQPGQAVQLKLRLAGKVKSLVRQDATAAVASENFLGGKFLRLEAGSLNRPPVTDGGVLLSRATPDMNDQLAQASQQLNGLLTEMGQVLRDVRQGQGALGAVTQDVAQSTAKLNRVLGQLESAMDKVNKGEGTLGKFVQKDDVYEEAVQSLQDLRRLFASAKQNSDAIKSMPVVRSYVVDVHKELVRPDCDRHAHWLPADKLFEPGRAILTPAGKLELDKAAEVVNKNKEANSEVVVAAFAGPGMDSDIARTLTEKQSLAVAEYLRNQHHVHRVGWWWWSNRPVRAVGVGSNPPALAESRSLPADRVEMIVFVPRN